MRLIDQQLGRILFGVAVAIAVAVNVMNPPMTVEPEPESSLRRPVQVKLVKSELATESIETYFAADGGWTQPADRFVFAEPKVAFVFQPVDLDVPPASIGRAPQVLPEPGPSLEGASGLPRFGDEFAPIAPGAAPSGGGDQGRPGTTATSGAGTSSVPPSPVFNPFGGK